MKADASKALTVAIAFIACALAPAAVAGEQGTAAPKEISHLLTRLGASGCQFNRNGIWNPPERTASGSSVSGKPYLVECGDVPAVPSAHWLRATPSRYRGGAR